MQVSEIMIDAAFPVVADFPQPLLRRYCALLRVSWLQVILRKPMAPPAVAKNLVWHSSLRRLEYKFLYRSFHYDAPDARQSVLVP
jgi:hypothetical protein